jgi:hypothetical protein
MADTIYFNNNQIKIKYNNNYEYNKKHSEDIIGVGRGSIECEIAEETAKLYLLFNACESRPYRKLDRIIITERSAESDGKDITFTLKGKAIFK